MRLKKIYKNKCKCKYGRANVIKQGYSSTKYRTTELQYDRVLQCYAHTDIYTYTYTYTQTRIHEHRHKRTYIYENGAKFVSVLTRCA